MMLRIEKTVFADIQKAMDSPETVACPQGLHLYGLPIFWKIAQDPYKTQSDLSDADILSFAISSMKENIRTTKRKEHLYVLPSEGAEQSEVRCVFVHKHSSVYECH